MCTELNTDTLYSFTKKTYLFPHDISGLHDAARGQAVVTGQQDGLLQCHTQGAAVGQTEKHKVKLQHTLPVRIFIRFSVGEQTILKCDAALSQHAVYNCHIKYYIVTINTVSTLNVLNMFSLQYSRV